MQRSLGKMSAHKMFNWRDRVANTIQQTVSAFLEVGEWMCHKSTSNSPFPGI